MSACDMMRVDGVHGQAWVTFTGALTAVPTGCCQATAHPHWPLSTLPPLPTPVSPGCHTFCESRTPEDIAVIKTSGGAARTKPLTETGKWRKTAAEGWIRRTVPRCGVKIKVFDSGEEELYFMLSVSETPGHLALHLGSSLIHCKWARNCEK